MAASNVDTYQEGYPLEIFKDPNSVDEKFLCNICHKIIREPVQSFCGHRFCKSCVHRKTSLGLVEKCMKCEKEGAEEEYSVLKMDQMFPDNAVKREMGKLRVHCVNNGCSWEGIFKEYEVHSSNCEFKPVPCDACHQPVSAADMDEHKAKYCSARLVTCPHCKTDLPAGLLEDHDKICPKKPVKCEACGAGGKKKNGLIREKLQNHLDNECTKVSVVCPAGCGIQLLKSELGQHLQKQHQDWQMTMNMSLVELSRINIPQLLAENQQAIATCNDRMAAMERQLVDVINEATLTTRIRQAVEMHQTTQSQRIHSMEVKVNTFQGIVESLHQEISRLINGVEKHERHRQAQETEIEKLKSHVKSLERTLGLKDTNIAEHELRFMSLEKTTYDGTFIFKVTDFSKKRQDAVNGSCISIYSAPFYTSRRGYKMCVRLYPNGDGMGKGSNMSLFFVVMRSEFDALLRWPFQQRVTFCLINQAGGEHVVDSFRPDPNSSSFKRPSSDMNIASGCPLFIRLDVLVNPENGFIKDDTLFVKVVVDTTDIRDPLTTLDEKVKTVPVST